MEAELKRVVPNAEIRLVEGKGGIFDVRCNGKLIYSKNGTGRFPEEGEVARLIEKQIG